MAPDEQPDEQPIDHEVDDVIDRRVAEAREVDDDDDDDGPAVDLTVTLRLGLARMRKQKTLLCRILDSSWFQNQHTDTDGLINLLDFLQDSIVDQGLATERQVFGPDFGADDDDTRHRD